MDHFARSHLAATVRKMLSGADPLSDAKNGLFLAAPRRTGKSTFLRQDLMPELRAHGNIVIYVDLWSDKAKDPALLIAEAIGAVILSERNVFQKAMDATKGGVNFGPFVLDFEPAKIGRGTGPSVVDSLTALSEATKKPICLIVDEAQHALTSAAGENAMSALKSARDQMNDPAKIRLMLVMSGSDRDKLLRLVNSNGAPFWGSTITEMPELGPDFVAHLAKLIEKSYPQLQPVDTGKLSEAFRLFQHRPQFFTAAIESVLSPLRPLAPNVRFEDSVLKAAEKSVAEYEQQLTADFLSLPPLQQAIIGRMLTIEGAFRPYNAPALAEYKKRIGKVVTQSQVQAALENLRAREEPLVWKSARGEYSLNDTGFKRWYVKRAEAKSWPPQSP